VVTNTDVPGLQDQLTLTIKTIDVTTPGYRVTTLTAPRPPREDGVVRGLEAHE
jgi:hypothetical protein